MRTPQLNLPLRVARATLALQRPALGGVLPLPASRRWLEVLTWGLPEPGGLRHEWITLGGRRTLVVTPVDALTDAAVLYLHGGGYVAGSPTIYRSMAGYLAIASQCPVYVPDYRLAPEFPFPAALDDAVAAYRELVGERGIDPSLVAVGGDSAGGGLSVATARRVIDAGLGAPAALALIAPWVDLSQRSERPRDSLIRDSWGAKTGLLYAGSAGLLDPGVSPARGSLEGLPPTHIQIGAEEILLPQVLQFAELLSAADVSVTVREYDWMWHVAHTMAGLVRPAAAAISELGVFIRTAQTPSASSL